MKPKNIAYLLLPMVVVLSGCVPTGTILETVSNTPELATLTVTPMPTDTLTVPDTYLLSPTAIPPTTTSTQTPTFTPLPTMEAEQGEETMSTLLQEPIDCPAPCFWGIAPGQTTLGEARNIFAHLGLQVESTTYNGKDFHGIRYDFESGMSIIVTLTVQNDLVINLRVDITPEKSQPGISRKWLAYSPETLINRYGPPSKVDFYVGGAAPTPGYSMDMYFDTVDLIIEYGGYDYAFDGSSFEICPLTNQWEYVWIWMGQNPQHPPPSFGVPLQEATSLTLDGFAKLMIGDPQDACIKLNSDAFP